MCVLYLMVSLCFEMCLELFVCKDTCLRQAIHTPSYFYHHHAVDCDCIEVVLCDNGGGNDCYGNAHVFVFCHGCAEVEIFDVCCGVSCSMCGDGGVEMAFDCGEVCGGSGKVTIVCDSVTSNCEPHSFWFRLLRANGGYSPAICCLFVFGF